MSQILSKIKGVASKLNNQCIVYKSSESTNSPAQSWTVLRQQFKPGPCMTNNRLLVLSVGLLFVPAMLVISALLAPVLFFVNNTYATTSSINLTIVSGTENPSINIPPTTEGKFVASSNTTAKVVSNHAAGYVLTTTATPLAFTDTSTSPSTTYTINPLASGTAINADTFSNESNTQYNNKWGYKPSQYYDNATGQVVNNNTSNTNFFFPAPINTTQTIDNTSTVTPAAGTTYDVAIGARIDNTAQMGTYTSSFTFAVVGNLTPYSITYNANAGSDTVTNMPSPNPMTGNVDQSTDTVTLSNVVPEREGYIFKGWCSTATNDDTCSGTTYNPDGGGTDLALTINQTSSSNSYNLYAMWKSAVSDLYSVVESAWVAEGSRVQTNDTDANTGIQADITTSNSGVFKYNSSVFGISSDASNDYDIYYYRGILDNTVGSYGSDGDNEAHPNTVLLDANKNGVDTTDTCWRIVRTTGSGGVKMIYQGNWTGSTCANATTNAEVTTSAYNGDSTTNRQIVRVGYTYNSTYATNTASTATIAEVLGSDSNPSVNNARSNIKTYIEDTWYTSSNGISAYTSILEPSAGYCSDRTVYDNTAPYTLQPESTSIVTYGTSGMTLYYFGSIIRNNFALSDNNNRALTLNCARSTVDLYRYVENGSGTSNELKYPTALLTADEAAFAGSGTSTATRGSAYHSNSFLSSGSDFWLLSPGFRTSGGYACEFSLYLLGFLSSGSDVYYARGVRPAISLTSGTTATSGTGTATDPWVVPAP